MSGQELSFRSLARQLRIEALPLVEPPPELWSRIVAAHAERRRRQASVRLGAIGLALAAGLTAIAIVPHWLHPPGDSGTSDDWQRQAQALELELRTLGHMHSMDANRELTAGAESELDRIDRALQQAYDRGADQAELAGLWRQRSDLLNTLITAQKQNRAVTRI